MTTKQRPPATSRLFVTTYCPIDYLMEHTAAFLGRLLDVIDGEIVPKTNAALQVRAITWGDKPIASYSLYFFMTRAGAPSRDPRLPCHEPHAGPRRATNCLAPPSFARPTSAWSWLTPTRRWSGHCCMERSPASGKRMTPGGIAQDVRMATPGVGQLGCRCMERSVSCLRQENAAFWPP